MSFVVSQLAAIGRELPTPATPLAAYVPAVRSGALVFTAGQLPLIGGELIASGLVIDNADETVVDGWVVDQGFVDVDSARECAAVAALNAIAAVGTVVDDVDRIIRIVKVTGYVAAAPGFTSHPQVINGASELIAAVWGDAGAHARSAVGVASLPLNSPVEIELVVEVAD
jgi:enamine deaminase RidA (YjgF/YER057c/UK114 family)